MRLSYAVASASLVIAAVTMPAARATGATPTASKAATIALAASTSNAGALPFVIFEGKPWNAAAGVEYAKIHLHFEETVRLYGVTVRACAGREWKDPISLFVNFDEVEPMELLPPDGKTAQELTYFDAEYLVEARSMTLNFNGNAAPCVAGIDLLGANRAKIPVAVPQVVDGVARASSTLIPVNSYDVAYLFDSRFEYAWSTHGKGAGSTIEIELGKPRQITRLKLWNGYQRSDRHCYANARLKRLKVTGEGGYAVEIDVKDVMGAQEVALPKPYTGRAIRLEVAAVYAGKSYKDLVVSELRLGDEAGWFLPDVGERLRAIAADNRMTLARAGLDAVLDVDLNPETYEESPDCGKTLGSMRLRSDGSVYLETPACTVKDTAMGKVKYALGNYEVKKVDAATGTAELRIFGLLGENKVSMDCNGCGRDCNGGKDGGGGRIFEDTLRVTLVKKPKLGVKVENISKVRRFDFKTRTLEVGA